MSSSQNVIEKESFSDIVKNLSDKVVEKLSLDRLTEMQGAALEKLSASRFPLSKDEDWKYTSLASYLKSPLCLPVTDRKGVEAPSSISSFPNRLVIINGAFSKDLSCISSDAAIKVYSTGDVLPDAFNNSRFNRPNSKNEGPKRSSSSQITFPLLNDLLNEELIYIEAEAGSCESIEITHIANPENENEMRCPRLFVKAGEGAVLDVIEHFIGYSSVRSITNHVAEFVLEDKAKVCHLKLQRESSQTLHLSSVFSEQGANSLFKNINLSFGASIARNEIYPSIPSSESEAWLIGANVLNDNQVVDNFTVIDHIAPHCESHELYKGIYAGNSKGVFSGTIIVQREAQKTNAYQSNSSILYSDSAESYSKPQLKIWADDVKCSHGATVGQIDEEAMFYLRARGIPANEAKAILTRAYIADVLEHIEDEPSANFINSILDEKLNQCQLQS
jgi:Fe-S cluster assembly protein SufD